MARRSRGDEAEGVNLDSLMDALTNVVAVLILVLVLVQADVSRKVSDFLDNLEPATPEEIQQSKEMLTKTQAQKDKLVKLLEEDAPSSEEIEKEKTQLAILEEDAKERKELLADLEELRKLEKKSREEKDSEEEKTSEFQKRIAELEAQLDQTPQPVPPPATVVNIPNSRPIPKSAKIYYAMVHKDRVHFIDPFTPEEQYTSIVSKKRRDWLIERQKRKGADKYIYDQNKVVEYFKQQPLKNSRNQQIVIPLRPASNVLSIEIRPDFEKGGTSIEELQQKRSLFGDVMRKLSSDRRAVVMFKVHPNGFHTYLEARRVADRNRVPAGWEVSNNLVYRVFAREIGVKPLRAPLPPKPPSGPQPPKPPTIGPKLD